MHRRVISVTRRSFSSTGKPNLGGMSSKLFYMVCETFSPFINQVFEPVVEVAKPGELSMKLAFKSVLIGNPANRCYHGGVVATMIDHVGGFCAWSTLVDPHQRVSTVDLRIDYLAPAPYETLYFDAVLSHRSKTLVRTDVTCWNSDKSKKIATGRGLFNVYTTPHDINTLANDVSLIEKKA